MIISSKNMTSEKSLLMNVSKDELDTIDEILQSRQPEILSDKKTAKFRKTSQHIISGSTKLNFPVSVLTQGNSILIETNTVSKQKETAAESVTSDDGIDMDDNFSVEIPETLEDLILFEHNYAVKYSPALKRKENDNALEIDPQEKCDIKKIHEITDISSSISEVSENPTVSQESKSTVVSTPIRRSKRQIEKIEREQVAASNVDVLDQEISKEKLMKQEEKKPNNDSIQSLKIEPNLNSNIELSNYKSFSEFKKRHLKVIVEDCKKGEKEEESVSEVLPTCTKESLHDFVDNKPKKNSTFDDKGIHNLKQEKTEPRSKCARKTKISKSSGVESEEKSKTHDVPEKKNISLNLNSKCIDSPLIKSQECEKKYDKNVNEHFFKEKKKSIEHCKKNLTHLGKKRKKHASFSSKLSDNADIHPLSHSPHIKRKKCVSFSEDLFVGNKSKAIPKQGVSSDDKELNQKSATSAPVVSTASISKVHKKKILRRDSVRLINDDGPALFSQPDVMIKVCADDNVNKKDENEIDSFDRPNKEKTTDMPGIKNNSKENIEISEKQMLLDKSENDIPLLKLKQEKETIKIIEEKEKQTFKSKQEDRGKHSLKQKSEQKVLQLEDNGKQTFKQEKEKELKQEDDKKSKVNKMKQMLKQDDKSMVILSQEEKERQFLKEEESKENQTNEAKEIPEVLEEKHTEVYHDEEPVCNNDDNCVHPMDLDNLQDSAAEFDQQSEIQHSYNNFTNIEAFLESSKFHTIIQEVKKNDSTDLKHFSQSTIEAPEQISNEKDQLLGALKHDNNDNLLEPESNRKFDIQVPSISGINKEAKLIPERKSRRLIKKKEFFGDTSDSSDDKKASAAKNKQTYSDKPSGRGRRSIKKKRDGIIKDGELDGKNGRLDLDDRTDSDSSEEDDPKKLWCICRKPHNSRFMIQCDKCEDWFHGSCVGVTKQYGRQLEKQKKEWNCPNCRSKDELSPQKADKSVKPTESSNERNSKIGEQDESRTKSLLHNVDTNVAALENNKMSVYNLKNSPSSVITQLPCDITSKKEKVHSLIVEKSDKISKGKTSKELSHPKTTAVQPSFPGNSKTIDDSLTSSSLSKQPPLLNTKSDFSIKSHELPQQSLPNSLNTSPNKKESVAKVVSRSNRKSTSKLLDSKKKLNNTLKEKDIVVAKKQSCVHCQSDARANSCYCSDDCIEKYATHCLKMMREAKGSLQGPEFDSQRLVVLDNLKGNLISSENGPTAGEIVPWLKLNPSFIITGSSNATSATKKDVNSQKKEPESSSCLERRDNETSKTTIRINVRKTLKNILLERCKKADDLDMSEEDVQKIAIKIEEELNVLFKDNSFKYRAKYRSLMFNIKDPRNQGLFRKILKGNIPPDKLVRMTPEELASMELAKWREQENQHLLDMIKRVQLEQQKSGSGLLLKKTHKGEVEIEDDLTSVIEQDVPKTVLKDLPEDVVEVEKEEVKDSTHLHRSHLFDLNCKICTGKIVPPPVDENISKKVRVAHSISVDLGSPNTPETMEKSVPKVVEGKSPVSNAGDDSMDQVPTSTVSIESPDISTKSSLKDKSFSSVWKGFIFMQDIAKFVTSAYKVSGPTDHLQADLPDTIQVCGRIVPDQVWEYLGKIKQSGNKELVIIRFQAANEEEAVAYKLFYSYLSSRKRYGVVSNYSKKIKDFYLLPLAAASPVPMVLVPFDGPGLPSPRPHLLLGVIVRHKFKQALLPVVTKQHSLSTADVEPADGSYTPPHEPRSYTPPLPTSSTLDESKEQEDKSVVSPDSATQGLSTYDAVSKDTDFRVEKFTTTFTNQVSISDASSLEKDDDKPYDPEQDILNIPPETTKPQNISFSVDNNKDAHLEQQKKILDALNRQVEETENALKQLISPPEDDTVVQSPNAPSLDINSITETGMSSFLDLPENLQEILNTVRSKSCGKEVGDVDMRIKTLFGKHFNEQKNEGTQHSEIFWGSNNSNTPKNLEEIYNPQAATPPPNDEDMDRSTISCPSDPRIKLRTSFQDISFMSKDAFSSNVSLKSMSSDVTAVSQTQLPLDEEMEVPSSKLKSISDAIVSPNNLLSGWNSGKEPPPPGIEPTESPSQESLSIQANPHTPVPQVYAANVQDNSQNVSSTFYPHAFPSFQPHLPLGFSVHTPPPNIKHFPPPPIVSTSFPPPPSLPIHVASTLTTESSLVKDQWPALPASGHQSEGNKWPAGSSHWKETTDPQGSGLDGDSRYYSSDRTNDSFYKRDGSNRHWDRSQRFVHGHWVRNPSRGNFTNQRRGKRGPSFRRNIRN